MTPQSDPYDGPRIPPTLVHLGDKIAPMHVVHNVVSVQRVDILRDDAVHVEYHSRGHFDIERLALDHRLPNTLATVKPRTFLAMEIVKPIFACTRGFNSRVG